MIESALADIVDRFNRRAERTESVREELAGLQRTVTVQFADGASYSVDLKDCRLQNLRPGAAAHPDLTISTDRATFESLLKKEMGPIKAIVTRKLKIDGSLEDKLLFRKLL
ncbi:MAG: SCP2 sterol-binding domain-containing protein [Thermoplasmata archaeon]|nr:SCP2 sterol-binding domain-containing protein [Thermoplasmata archaeon]